MDIVTDLLQRHGIALVFANVLLTQLALPVPAVPTLILAGAFVVQGHIALAPLVVMAVLAALLGDTPWYLAGRRYGYRVLQTLCRISVEPDSCVRQTEEIFERWGPASLIVAKYIPGFAAIAPPLAGAMRLSLPLFLLYSAISALLWAGVPIALGMIFHAQVELALDWLEGMGAGAAAALAILVIGYVAVKTARRYLLIRFLRMARIGPVELRALMAGEDRPIILDVRSAAARRLDPRRIAGAIAVDIDDPDTDLGVVPRDRELVLYCT